MRRKRGILALISLLTLCVVSAAGGWTLLAGRLPDPATADREALMRWMVLRDLSAESPDTRQKLIARLEGELRDGVDLKQVDTAVSDERRERFWKNVDLLLSQWFSARAEAYAAQPETRKVEYVERQIDEVFSWKTVARLRKSDRTGDSANETTLLLKCQQKVNGWIQRSAPQQAARMRSLQAAVNANLMARYLREMLNPRGNETE